MKGTPFWKLWPFLLKQWAFNDNASVILIILIELIRSRGKLQEIVLSKLYLIREKLEQCFFRTLDMRAIKSGYFEMREVAG